MGLCVNLTLGMFEQSVVWDKTIDTLNYDRSFCSPKV